MNIFLVGKWGEGSYIPEESSSPECQVATVPRNFVLVPVIFENNYFLFISGSAFFRNFELNNGCSTELFISGSKQTKHQNMCLVVTCECDLTTFCLQCHLVA
jgi:hypothetical protein